MFEEPGKLSIALVIFSNSGGVYGNTFIWEVTVSLSYDCYSSVMVKDSCWLSKILDSSN